MKVVAFNGSPRVEGNTCFLLKKVLGTLKEQGIDTELIQIGNQEIRGCTACFTCMKKQDKKCVIDSDCVNEAIQKMIDADGILLGSPTYFADVSSQMKALIDRAGFVAHANGRLFKRKVAAAVVAVRRGGATNVVDSINKMFLMSQMIVPGSTYWNFGIGLEEGAVAHDTEGLANMQDLGETMAWLIKKIRLIID